jgi:hypothetical protein
VLWYSAELTDCDFGLLGKGEGLIQVGVVAKRLIETTVLSNNFVLDSGIGGN